MAGKEYSLVTEHAESESTCIPIAIPADDEEPGPTTESDSELALDTEPTDESTIESKPAFELKPGIDSCHYSG